MPERQEMLKSMKIDIVDELEAEASYRYFDLFQRAADEIKMLRKAVRGVWHGAADGVPRSEGKDRS